MARSCAKKRGKPNARVKVLVFDYQNRKMTECARVPDEAAAAKDLMLVLHSDEMPSIVPAFNFPLETVRDCLDLDETIRYATYEGFDFLSLVRMERVADRIELREYNVYISRAYLVVVLPDEQGEADRELRSAIIREVQYRKDSHANRIAIYYGILHALLASYSSELEALEDEMEALLEAVAVDVGSRDFAEIYRKRKAAYTSKKLLRAMSMTAGQILQDENGLLDRRRKNSFANCDARFQKLYGYAQDLYELSGQLLTTYDSRVTLKTNEIVNKLTLITLFFGPLTVITGIYGMNFAFMPELKWRFGYPFAIAVMAAVSLALYAILKRKKWM
jgi:magnesium transporter